MFNNNLEVFSKLISFRNYVTIFYVDIGITGNGLYNITPAHLPPLPIIIPTIDHKTTKDGLEDDPNFPPTYINPGKPPYGLQHTRAPGTKATSTAGQRRLTKTFLIFNALILCMMKTNVFFRNTRFVEK